MKKKDSYAISAFNIFNICILSILALVCIYPIWYVLMASLSNGNLIMQHSGLLLLPIKPNFAAYIAVFKNKMILSGYLNTCNKPCATDYNDIYRSILFFKGKGNV